MRRSYDLEVEVTRHLARSLGVSFVDLEEYVISPGILSKVARDFSARYRCVPMVCNRRRVVLVHEDPADILRLSADPGLLATSGLEGVGEKRTLEFALTTPPALTRTLERRLALPR